MRALRLVIAHAAGLLCGLAPSGLLAGFDLCPPARTFAQAPVKEAYVSGVRSKGLLWRVEPAHGPASYLFGTFHLADEKITRLAPAVAVAMANADRLVSETVLDRASIAYYQRHMYSRRGPNLGSMFAPPARERLLNQLSNYGVDRRTALRLRPWAAFTILAGPTPTGKPTLDQVLQAKARQQQKPVYGLQHIGELVSALAGIPFIYQREILIDTVCNSALIKAQARELLAQYVDGDLAGMWATSFKYQPRNERVARAFKERILDARNRIILARLQPHLEHGNAFVAVGALHLPGNEGLLRGLEKLGYDVTAVD